MDNEEFMPDGDLSAQNREQLKHGILKPGEGFGNFRIVKCLCAGLIANYYHMQHVRDLHDVTVAVFHHRVTKEVKLLKRLDTLQKTIQTLDHGAIPKIRDCMEIDDRICLFMDPVEGQTLSQYFDANRAEGKEGLGVEASTRIMAQLLGILGYVHAQGLDHRDLDSDLIFIQEDGSIRLLGLGVKAILGVEVFESIVSASVSPLASPKTNGRLNSFDVMSPEYKSGLDEDLRVDVFCVGVTGYWLLTGRKPEMAKFVRPSELVEGVLGRWDDFFEQILQRDPERRYQSCKSVLLALKETDDEPTAGRSGLIQKQIDRIPVPKNIVERGDLAARIYRLSFIGFVGLTLTALMAFFLSLSLSEKIDSTEPVAQRVAEGQSPQLRIKVTPPVARIEFNGHDESFVTNGGELELRVLPGSYKVKASAPRHVEIVESVKISAEDPDSIQELSFELKPAWTDIQVRSEPEAFISVVDARDIEIELGTTDSEGVFFLKEGLFAGTQQLIIKKEGYAPKILKNEELDLGEVALIEAPLTALPASLTVRTIPEGARVSVDDIDVGLSPVTIDDIEPKEQYLVVAQLENFRSIGRRIEVPVGDDVVVDFGELTPRSAELVLDVEFAGVSRNEYRAMLAETVVVVGESRFPFGSDDLKFIPEGEYSVHLEHPQYISERVDAVFEDRDVKKLSFTLKPRPGEVWLLIPSDIEPAVRLNRQSVELDGDVVSIPANAPVEFELRIHNYFTMVREFELEPNEKVVWEVEPVPIPGPKRGDLWIMPYLGFKFAWIPPGEFTMGSPMPEQGRLPNEGPATEVRFTKGFWAGVFEITQAEFYKIMDRNPSEFPGAKKPVDSILWKDAVAFCEILTILEREAGRLPEGYVYRLPTEAEWEYAARAGTLTPFHFGSVAEVSMGNFRGVYPRELEEGQRVAETYGTEEVGGYAPNAYGLYDVHGNVSEWTIEAYNGRLPGGSLTDPTPRVGGKRFAVRGGSWKDFAVQVRTAVREDIRKDTESSAIGFRVFLAPEK